MDWMKPYANHLSNKRYLDAFATFTTGVGPERARKTPHWLIKVLLSFFIPRRERESMLRLLNENLREHTEVARLDSSYRNYREISANVLLMYGGKSDSRWVLLSMERLANVLQESITKEFPALDHFGINRKAPIEVARAVGDHFLG